MKNYSPVKVDIIISKEKTITSSAFTSVCFITENDQVQRTTEVTTIQDVLDAGYLPHGNAYNFCLMALSSNRSIRIFLRAKRTSETYHQAYLTEENNNYYFVVIESKDISKILEFNDLIQNDMKLQFFSTNTDVTSKVKGRKLVWYYQDSFGSYLQYDSSAFVLLDSEDYIRLDDSDTDGFFHPEAAWLGRCGTVFPSKIQWLYKELNYVDVTNKPEVFDLATTYAKINNDRCTFGSGKTCQGYPIEHVVSIDWVSYALKQNCWSLLYTQEKVNATVEGVELFEQRIREVLSEAVRQDIFTSAKVVGRELDRYNHKVSFKFVAYLQYSILGVNKVEGTIYQ